MTDSPVRPELTSREQVASYPTPAATEAEPPRLRRRIDCAGNPEITDRRRVARGAPPLSPQQSR